jgi:hypothetical protein
MNAIFAKAWAVVLIIARLLAIESADWKDHHDTLPLK